VDTGNPPVSEESGIGSVGAIAERVLRFPLTTAGFQFDQARGWTRENDQSFTGVSVRVIEPEAAAHPPTRGGMAMTFGWRYAAFGDPEPSPSSAEGCIRQLSIDDFAAGAGARLALLPDLSSRAALAAWEQRLATTLRQQVVGWLEAWKRPAGFRDFLSDRRFHLTAAWLSAMLGHRERLDLELRSAAALNAVPLEGGFDRHLADRDEAFAAPLAARHGLAAVLVSAEAVGDQRTLDAFGGAREVRARDRVTDPGREHARLLRRHEVYAALCVEYLR